MLTRKLVKTIIVDPEDLQTWTPKQIVDQENIALGECELVWHTNTDPRTGMTKITIEIEGTEQQVAWWILSNELPVGLPSKY